MADDYKADQDRFFRDLEELARRYEEKDQRRVNDLAATIKKFNPKLSEERARALAHRVLSEEG